MQRAAIDRNAPTGRGIALMGMALFFVLSFLLFTLPAYAAPHDDFDALSGEEDAHPAPLVPEYGTSPQHPDGPDAAGISPFDRWTWRNPLPWGYNLFGVAYGKGTFVAVGDGVILTSPDGHTWTRRASSTANESLYLHAVAYGNGTFVAVGYRNGTTTIENPVIVTSRNGITWTGRTSPVTDKWLYGVTYGNGTFVAVGLDGTLLTSPDGITWTKRALPETGATFNLYAVTYANGTFVAGGYSSLYFVYTVNSAILTSPDGITWTRRTLPETNKHIDGIAYGNGTFVAIASEGAIYTSPDGITWATGTLPVSSVVFSAITYANGTFTAVGWQHDYNDTADPGISVIFTSPDGFTWTGRALPEGSESLNLQAVAYGNGTFTAVGSGGIILTSSKGVTWQKKAWSVSYGWLASVTYGKSIFVAVGHDSTHTDILTPVILTSTKGATWQKKAPTVRSGSLSAVTCGKDTFVAVGVAHKKSYWEDNTYILTSPDGVRWTERTSPVAGAALSAIAYGNGTFVAVGSEYNSTTRIDTPVILTSVDGITWTGRSSPFTKGEINGIAYGNGAFVAVGSGVGSGGIVLTSPDGITWTGKTLSAAHGGLLTVAYGNGTFLAAGDGLYTSPDGITWTARTSPPVGISVIIFHIATFVAAGDSGAGSGFIFTSPDGITWTRRISPPTAGGISGFAYGNATLVAVGGKGTILQSDRVGYPLIVAKPGTGSGTVLSSPSGIDCGSACSTDLAVGTVVTLTATPATGSTFTGWSGACRGTGTCTVRMNGNVKVKAVFTIKRFTVTASVSGGHGAARPPAQNVSYGSSASISLIPARGYRVATIKDNGESKTASTPYIIKNTTTDHTVEAVFAPKSGGQVE